MVRTRTVKNECRRHCVLVPDSGGGEVADMILEFLLKFHKEIIIAVMIAAIGLFYHLWQVDKQALALSRQNTQVAMKAVGQCRAAAQVTERINHAYQNDISRLHAVAIRLRATPPKCLRVITGEAGVHSGQLAGHGHGEGDGVSRGWLYEYAIKAEKYRIQRNACKAFVNQTWAALK
jgi:hypothetical protein